MNNTEMSNNGQHNNPWQVDRPVPVPDRATRVASWVGWHFMELTGVTVPAVVAVAVTPWAWIVSSVVGAGWTVHGVRQAREQAAVKAGRDLPGADAAGRGSDVDEIADGPAAEPDTADTADTGDDVEDVAGTGGDAGREAGRLA